LGACETYVKHEKRGLIRGWVVCGWVGGGELLPLLVAGAAVLGAAVGAPLLCTASVGASRHNETRRFNILRTVCVCVVCVCGSRMDGCK
jgi:hypothetical protein